MLLLCSLSLNIHVIEFCIHLHSQKVNLRAAHIFEKQRFTFAHLGIHSKKHPLEEQNRYHLARQSHAKLFITHKELIFDPAVDSVLLA